MKRDWPRRSRCTRWRRATVCATWRASWPAWAPKASRLLDAVAAAFEAGAFGAPIIRTPRLDVGFRNAAARPGRIEAALLHGPGVAFVAIGGLLRLALAVLGIDVDVGAVRRRV